MIKRINIGILLKYILISNIEDIIENSIYYGFDPSNMVSWIFIYYYKVS
jgi:hypothetical protein